MAAFAVYGHKHIERVKGYKYIFHVRDRNLNDKYKAYNKRLNFCFFEDFTPEGLKSIARKVDLILIARGEKTIKLKKVKNGAN